MAEDTDVPPGTTLLDLSASFAAVKGDVEDFKTDKLDRAIKLPGVVGLNTIEITVVLEAIELVDDPNTDFMAFPAVAEVFGRQVEVVVGVVWSGAGADTPDLSLGIEAPDLSLDVINEDWLADVLPEFGSTWISLSSTGHAIPSSSVVFNEFYPDGSSPASGASCFVIGPRTTLSH